jgi:hypothetical protein
VNDNERRTPSAEDPMPALDDEAASSGDVVTIAETAVGLLGDRRVGAGNIWAADYELPDGTIANGMTAQLFVLGEDAGKIVGQGSVLEIDGARWEVTAVEKPEERRHGRVTLRRR